MTATGQIRDVAGAAGATALYALRRVLVDGYHQGGFRVEPSYGVYRNVGVCQKTLRHNTALIEPTSR